MTTASVSSEPRTPCPAPGSSSQPTSDVGDTPQVEAGTDGPGGLERLPLMLDRDLVAVRRHDLELAGRVPQRARRYVDTGCGMLEFVVPDGVGGDIVLALAPGARGDTVVPLLPAPRPARPDGRDVSALSPFDEVVGEAIEDVSRVLTHLERPDELRGVVLHLGGRMLMVYADLWELRVTLLP